MLKCTKVAMLNQFIKQILLYKYKSALQKLCLMDFYGVEFLKTCLIFFKACLKTKKKKQKSYLDYVFISLIFFTMVP